MEESEAEARKKSLMRVCRSRIFGPGGMISHRQFEWKVTLGLWALILAGISYHEKLKDIPHEAWLPICWTTFSIYSYLWLFPLWRVNRQDSEQAFSA